MAVGLGISPRHFLDDEQATRLQQFEEVSRFMSERLNRSDLADSFAEYVTKKARFRNEDLTYDDLYEIAKEFLSDLYE